MNADGHPSFFMGRAQTGGNPAYFPTLLLTKSPPALLAILVIGGALSLRAARRSSLAVRVVGIVALGLLAAMMASKINIGVRHALPVVPLLAVLAGRAFDRAWTRLAEARAALGAVLASAGITVLDATPAYLSYYNPLALGRGADIAVVGEDWGQDRAAFVALAKERRLRPLYYDAMTATRALEVGALGLEYKSLSCRGRPRPPAWVAVHAAILKARGCYPWAKGLTPLATVNDHILVYWLPKDADQGEPAKAPELPAELPEEVE